MNTGPAADSNRPTASWRTHWRALVFVVLLTALYPGLRSQGGPGAVAAAIQVALLVSVLVVLFLPRRNPAVFWVFGTALAGAMVATMLGLRFGDVNIEALNEPPGMKPQQEPITLGRWAFFGALPGALLGALWYWFKGRRSS